MRSPSELCAHAEAWGGRLIERRAPLTINERAKLAALLAELALCIGRDNGLKDYAAQTKHI